MRPRSEGLPTRRSGGVDATERLWDAIVTARPTGSLTLSTSGWTAGQVIAALIECEGRLQAELRTIALLRVGCTLAQTLGLPDRTTRSALVGGVRTFVSSDLAPDMLELVIGAADRGGLH